MPESDFHYISQSARLKVALPVLITEFKRGEKELPFVYHISQHQLGQVRAKNF